jgi:ATP-dependent helicase/DNAse subunit B
LKLLTSELAASPHESGWQPLPKSKLPIPPVDRTLEVPPVSVTAFSTYLQCPYRFYLRHVLKLRPLDDDAPELAANQFGDLVHGALEFFGESEDKGSTDPDEIFLALKHQLRVYVDKTFGKPLSQALTLQMQQAEKRLRFVADRQAERIAQGWHIHQVEASVGLKQAAYLSFDDVKLQIRGRFDRIDYHPQSDRWAILDYKTHGHKPEKKHFRRNRSSGEINWLDLQLPLYRMMIPHLGIKAPPNQVDLGYFNVSDKETETGIHLADFDEDLMQQAEEVIHQCVRGIVDKDFNPTSDTVQYDDYQMILQTGTAARMLAGSLDEVEVMQ